jgi:hypothetical protein
MSCSCQEHWSQGHTCGLSSVNSSACTAGSSATPRCGGSCGCAAAAASSGRPRCRCRPLQLPGLHSSSSVPFLAQSGNTLYQRYCSTCCNVTGCYAVGSRHQLPQRDPRTMCFDITKSYIATPSVHQPNERGARTAAKPPTDYFV